MLFRSYLLKQFHLESRIINDIDKLDSILTTPIDYKEINEYIAKETREGGNLAASKIRNLECPSYEICLIDYGCGKFNRKIHIMEQYP